MFDTSEIQTNTLQPFFANFSLSSLTFRYFLPSFFLKLIGGAHKVLRTGVAKLHSQTHLTLQPKGAAPPPRTSSSFLKQEAGPISLIQIKNQEICMGNGQSVSLLADRTAGGVNVTTTEPRLHNLHNGPGACKGEAGLFLNLRRRRQRQRQRGD